MSRFRVTLYLLASAAMATIALEMSWLSISGVAPETNSTITVGLAGAAAVPLATATVWFVLILALALVVLPWWLRIVIAVAGVPLISIALFQLASFAVEPDSSSLLAAVSGSDVVSERIQWLGPALYVLAAVLMFAGVMAVIRGARTWPTLGARYERGTAGSSGSSQHPGSQNSGSQNLWSRLDRGEDPTLDD